MTAFFFALCSIGPLNPPTHTYPALVSCQFVTREDCEARFHDCYQGWVETPKRRPG